MTTYAVLRCIGRADPEAAIAHLSPTVRYVVPGRSDLAGELHGPAEVAGHLLRLFQRTSGTLEALKWDDVMEGETHVVALITARAQRPGHTYHGRHLYLLAFDPDDRIDEIRLFLEDQGALDRFLDA